MVLIWIVLRINMVFLLMRFNIYDLINDGYLVLEDDCLKIDKKYMYISNEIIVRMFK